MKLRTLLLAFACLAPAFAGASAGLTSAGVGTTPTTTPDEPTLAQVAPVPGASAAAAPGTTAAAGNAAGANPPSIAGAPAGTGNRNAPATATTTVVTPPPPPDPATLPVSVIRPLSKNPASEPSPAKPAAATDVESSITQRDRRTPPQAPKPVANSNMPAAPPVAATSRMLPAAPARPDGAAAKSQPEAPADENADGASTGYIFYGGIAIAGVILLLSAAAFVRGREEPRAPRV